MPKHKKHIVEKWQRIVSASENSGLSARDYCRKNNLSVKSLYAWKTKLRRIKSQSNPYFSELQLKESTEVKVHNTAPSIDIFINDKIRISVTEDFNEALLLRTIKVLNNATC